MKRVFDMIAAIIGVIVLSPILVVVAVAIWAQDFHSPLYIATRVGRGGRHFRLMKFRSMVIRADRTGVDSTAGDDPRITAIGKFIRRTKIDEVPQLLNVLAGDMSLVGPRPNVERETELYTSDERRLLSIRPGITDLASIVFADEGEILRGSDDPDIRYNQVIRPWKSRLALLYVDGRRSVALDGRILWLTIRSAYKRDAALVAVAALTRQLGGDESLTRVALRRDPLRAAPPPGSNTIVQNRQVARAG
jgi:lipopolysaccharide/colanic/teichoic acid biosynthesis glycosyltransferase